MYNFVTCGAAQFLVIQSHMHRNDGDNLSVTPKMSTMLNH